MQTRAGLREFNIGDWVGQPRDLQPGERHQRLGPGGDLTAGCPGTETGNDIVARFTTVLEDLADQYRGETVVVVSHGTAMQLALGTAATTPEAVHLCPERAHCGVADVESDENGLRLLTFMGEVVAPPSE